MKLFKGRSFSILLAFVLWIPVQAQGPESIFDLMTYREVLELKLEADFGFLKENRRNDEYQDARLSFTDAAGHEQSWDMEVKIRGAFRRLKCTDIPPLKLKFKKSQLREAGLADFNDMKLVPQCVSDELLAKDLLLREYLAYKLFNELSEYSFRVQLLRITYEDSETGQKSRQWAFLIEDTAQLRDRIGGAEKCEKCYNMPIARFDQRQLNTVAVFEYMIGNADWRFSTMKNVKLVVKDGQIITIPYDFDFSGMVNAPYAIPDPNYGLTSVKERVFLGPKENLGDLHDAIYRVAGARTRLQQIVMDFKLLSLQSRREIITYLEEYWNAPEEITPGVWALDGTIND